jgi:hypothetical protein
MVEIYAIRCNNYDWVIREGEELCAPLWMFLAIIDYRMLCMSQVELKWIVTLLQIELKIIIADLPRL